MHTFTALDVETANSDLASICQIGIVTFEDGRIVEEWESLIDPQDDFDPMNVYVHGITEEMVAGAPTFQQAWPEIQRRIHDRTVVHHMPFDCTAITRSCKRGSLALSTTEWLDTARVARRTWEDFAHHGYGLGSLAKYCQIQYQKHNALADAKTCGLIFLEALEASGTTVPEWVIRSRQPRVVSHDWQANLDGPLYGNRIVFTGKISLGRSEASSLAAQAGCVVDHDVTKKTSLLVVGDQDIRKLPGKSKSSKHEKAELLISKGQTIRILTESDFHRIVN